MIRLGLQTFPSEELRELVAHGACPTVHDAGRCPSSTTMQHVDVLVDIDHVCVRIWGREIPDLDGSIRARANACSETDR